MVGANIDKASWACSEYIYQCVRTYPSDILFWILTKKDEVLEFLGPMDP